jgi:hypothetical protein
MLPPGNWPALDSDPREVLDHTRADPDQTLKKIESIQNCIGHRSLPALPGRRALSSHFS